MENLELILEEVALLKSKQEALKEILSEKYKEIERIFSENRITKYTHGDIQAQLKKSSRVDKVSLEILKSVSNPEQFLRVVLNNVNLTRKLIQAMNAAGANTAPHVKLKESKALTITVGNEAKERIQGAMKEFHIEVKALTEELQLALVKKNAQDLLETKLVFPEKREVCDAG